MNITLALQELDDLFIEHTKPPVTAILRNKLSFCIEQAQARSADVERQEQTLATQIETIANLQKENQKLVSDKAKIEDELAKMKQRKQTPRFKVIDHTPKSTFVAE